MPRLTRNLDWKKPSLPQIIEELKRLGRAQESLLDLSGVRVMVSTRQSARLLHQRLAQAVGAGGRVLFPPQWCLPEELFSFPEALTPVSRRESLLLWASLLQEFPEGAYPLLFGSGNKPQNTEQALPWARMIQEAQDLLGENLWSFSQVLEAEVLPPSEIDRWEELARLDKEYHQRLRERNLCSPREARLAALEDPSGEASPEKLVLVLPVDPLPAVVHYLEALTAQDPELDIVVLTWGPEEARAFDPWGRPRPEYWLEENPPHPRLEGRIHPARNVREEALQVARLLEPNHATPGAVAVGLQEGEIIGPLRRQLPVFDPSGEPLLSTWLGSFLSTLAAWLETDGFQESIQILHTPLVQVRLQKDLPDFSLSRVLQEADRIRENRLPDTLRDVERALGEESALLPVTRKLREWGRALDTRPWGEALLNGLDYLKGDAELPGRQGAVWRRWVELLPEFVSCVQKFAPESPARFLSLVLELAREETYFPEVPEEGLRLQGWLELPLEEAPHLVLTEAADELLPGSRRSHLLLPESLREKLNLRHETTRLARDAWLLSCLDQSRREGGRLDFTVSRTNPGGEPRKPSRLLFLGPAKEQAERVKLAFADPRVLAPDPPWSLGFPVIPPAPGERNLSWEKVSVTAFRDYLQCPLRFYFKHGLRMEAYPAEKLEWDAGEFGTLAHQALEWLARDPELAVLESAQPIGEALTEFLERRVRGRYGRDLPLPLEIQLDSLHQRLWAWAEHEAQSRQAGWEILPEGVEWKPPSEDSRFLLEGVRISGMIDRMEKHRETGLFRILDFKTREKRTEPWKAHLTRWKENAGENFARVSHQGKDYLWRDLQLPLYVWMVQQEWPEAQLEVGYVHLPKAVGETGIELWNGLAESGLVEAALQCAATILQRMQAGVFWPPREQVIYDDFESFIFESVAEDIDGRHLQGVPE